MSRGHLHSIDLPISSCRPFHASRCEARTDTLHYPFVFPVLLVCRYCTYSGRKWRSGTLQSDIDGTIETIQERIQVQPLTHCNSAGETYQRTPAVLVQIEAALMLTSSQLLERVRIVDTQSPAYLQEECLVYLIHEFHRRGNKRLVNDLCEVLIGRCKNMIYGRLWTLGVQSVDDAFNDVILDVFSLILDLESDRGDFLQIRFGRVLQKLVIGVYNRHVRRKKAEETTLPLSSIAGHEAERDEEHGGSVPFEDVIDQSISMEQRLLYREGLNVLEEPYRTAFILRHYGDWPIEAKDSSVPTLSRHFQRTPRTIRAWLTHAEELLKHWRGESYE